MNNIKFVKPSQTISISLTNKNCFLNCPYCNKHYLINMKKISDIKNDKYSSILVSGGMNDKGCVPFIEHFNELLDLKNKNIKLNIHTGIIKNNSDFIKLKEIADCVSFDFLIHKETIKRIYGDFFTQKDFTHSIDNFLKNKIRVVPHVMIGVNEGEILGEKQAIDYLSERFDEIVFLVLIVNKNTDFALFKSPNIEDVLDIIKYGKSKIKNVSLGCMRPGGIYRRKLDIEALKLGVDKIVMPSKEAEKYALENKFLIEYSYECCVL
ncbi:MAG: radical SAM protein [Candidatus Muirbacterium halophilum]|nr:radical SAM protein [Candidatus Muirbacterium halophilum]